jgi:hypothetical protein
MRLAGWLRLAAVCLLVGTVQGTCSPASAQPAPRGPKTPLIKEEFKGYGLTQKDAEANALERACDWLSEHSANLGWTPTPEFLREKGMVQFEEPIEEEFKVAKDFADGGKMKVVKMQLEVTSDQAREIQKHARQERMISRHRLTAYLLGGLVCVLLVITGYLRLEEATKGYFTHPLRLAAIGIVILIILALGVMG